jgi:AcrR family transcriptional regulator
MSPIGRITLEKERPNMPRLTREERRALTRERLLAAAAKVFAGEGFGGSTIDRIVGEAGFTKGAFYSNFSSKEDIFLQLFEGPALHTQHDLEEKLADFDEPEAIVEAICEWATLNSREVDRRSLILDLRRTLKSIQGVRRSEVGYAGHPVLLILRTLPGSHWRHPPGNV